MKVDIIHCWRSFLFVIAVSFSFIPAFAYNLDELLEYRLDPSLEYLTLSLDNIDIHFPRSQRGLAFKYGYLSNKYFLAVQEKYSLEIPNSNFNLVLADQSDVPSFFAFSYPHHQVFLDQSLPDLSYGANYYGDLNEWVLSHELTHLMHMGNKSRTFEYFEVFFGSFSRPNILTPLWLKEGLAVYVESEVNSKGRSSSTEYMMLLRSAFLENPDLLGFDDFFRHDNIATNYDSNWPWGTRTYMVGFFLIKFIIEERNIPLKEVLGFFGEKIYVTHDDLALLANYVSFNDEMWPDFLGYLKTFLAKDTKRFEKEVLSEIEIVSEIPANYKGLEISKNGEGLLTTLYKPGEAGELLRISLKPEPKCCERVHDRWYGFQTSFSASSRFLAFDQTSRIDKYQFSSDIFIYDLKTEKVVSASRGLSAREPDIHSNGKNVLYVRNIADSNELVVSDSMFRKETLVYKGCQGERISNPRFSHEGDQIVFSLHNKKTGGEDIILSSAKELRTIVSNESLNLHTRFILDEKYILFSSDKDGIFNLYIADVENRKYLKIVNSRTGLFYPILSVDQKWIYFLAYRHGGYQVARSKFDSSQVTSRLSAEGIIDDLMSASPCKASILDESIDEKHSLFAKYELPYRWSRYWAPQYLRPSYRFFPGVFAPGIQLSATDPLFFNYYKVDLFADVETKYPFGELFLYNASHENVFVLEASENLSMEDRVRRRTSAKASILLPLSRYLKRFYLLTGVKYRQETLSERFLGPSVGILFGNENKQIGWDYLHQGKRLKFDIDFLPGLMDRSAKMLMLDYQMNWYSRLGDTKSAISFSMHGGYLAKTFQRTIDNQPMLLSAGGKLSFPYTLSSQYFIGGYGVDELKAREIHVLRSVVNLPAKLQVTDLSHIPTTIYGHYYTLEAALLNKDRVEGFFASAGIGYHLLASAWSVMPYKISLLAFQGQPKKGGETQLQLALDTDF